MKYRKTVVRSRGPRRGPLKEKRKPGPARGKIRSNALARSPDPQKTDPARSSLMKRVRRERTAPEETVGRALREAGMRFRRNVRDLPGSPDFANRKRRFAIFVNGCFWHHHKGCSRGSLPVANKRFWTKKFRTNRARDASKIRLLRAARYRVLIVWECECRNWFDLVARMSRFRLAVYAVPRRARSGS
jgi:DNA mismatch endonuclease (patch repair protein)